MEQGEDHWTAFISAAPDNVSPVLLISLPIGSPLLGVVSIACVLFLWHMCLLFHRRALHPWAEEHRFGIRLHRFELQLYPLLLM